jgi:hypothetical protein
MFNIIILLLVPPYLVVYEIMHIVLTEVQIYKVDQAESPLHHLSRTLLHLLCNLLISRSSSFLLRNC